MTPPTVLVVDDDDAVREVAAASLERVGGWRVITASGGPEAIEVATAERPDAVLLDVMMPGMDGPETLAALRENAELAELPVVFLTAKARPGEQERLLALGVAGVVSKPFDPMVLPGEIANVLGFGP